MGNFIKDNMTIEIIILIFSLIIAFIVVNIFKSNMKTVGKKDSAATYLEKGSFNLKHSSDIYLYKKLETTPKKKK